MDRTRRQELFWLVLIAGCIALFVAHRERMHRAADPYDRSGLTELMRNSANAPVADPNDDVVTGSIVKPASRPAASAARYYVPLGSYGSIDQATRRYLDLARRDPRLERDNKLRIETVSLKGDGTFHRVRMGTFATAQQARLACSHAGLSMPECPIVAMR
ncbi:MAG TPA: SPOR domain-containing protein [Parvibaculum sp.]